MTEPAAASAKGSSADVSGDWLPPRRLLALLEARRPALGVAASTLCLAAGEDLDRLSALGDAGKQWREKLAAVGPSLLESGCGLFGLQAGDRAVAIAPPFPIADTSLKDGWDEAPLGALLEASYTVGVVLVRLGRYSVAVYEGERLVSSKTDSRYVKGKHHAGGTSQLRYTRVREGQMRRLFDKVCEQVTARLSPPSAGLDYVRLGGEKFTLNGLLKVCPALDSLKGITLNRRLNIRDPKRDTLEQVGAMLRESRVWTLDWGTDLGSPLG